MTDPRALLQQVATCTACGSCRDTASALLRLADQGLPREDMAGIARQADFSACPWCASCSAAARAHHDSQPSARGA